MEFKKRTKPREIPTSNTPQRSNASPSDPHPADSPTPVRKAKRLALTKQRLAVMGIIVFVACILVILLANHFNGSNNSRQTNINEPEFQTILPTGRTVGELGGWKRVSPPESDPVFAYIDKLHGVPISVSEQQLPESFKRDTANQVAELAKKFNATTKVDAKDTSFYIGTSAKGPQSVILAKNNILILIKSQKKIDNKIWTEYINSLDSIDASRVPKY